MQQEQVLQKDCVQFRTAETEEKCASMVYPVESVGGKFVGLS